MTSPAPPPALPRPSRRATLRRREQPLAVEVTHRVLGYASTDLRALLPHASPTVAGAVRVERGEVACLFDTFAALALRVAALDPRDHAAAARHYEHKLAARAS